ncbi:hypothetical protein JCM17844_23950 [Iodidimonas gelatinilytica]|uniref:Uncharacterized protein n=1 Tax=Iodidimonas gelatinilytica TaxID=1236966 RepID=A0A5A7MUN6_9PROT|nr:hypothetical protein [Iodidimonas gelatinilytica]GEQ98758.1 hypothetical protein JCM17844_23950 [Iodidimonas gelatinilytica]
MIPGNGPSGQLEDDESLLNVTVSTVSHIIERAQEAYADMPQGDDSGVDVTERVVRKRISMNWPCLSTI